ncbi:MAG: MarC family protein [Alphaproteobacteria bacterium]|nr:MarC family protein [Alphaproteobacteria bacterium]
METFLSALVTLTVIIDPLGTAAVYGALTASLAHSEAEAIAKKSCMVGAGVLLFFGVMGSVVLSMLGITLDAFRIAGGLLLFVTAFRMLMGDHDQQNIQKDGSVYSDRGDIAVFPLAIPLLSGPGCITAIILLTNKSHAWFDQLQVYAAMALAVIASYVCMKAVQRLKTVLGSGGIQIMARLMGILLAAMAIQFIADGAKGLIQAMH